MTEPDPTSAPTDGTPDARRRCDVIIPTRNRPGPLQRCLRSLARQSATDFGIIVVDDHSDEPLDAVVAEVVAESAFAIEPVVIRLPEPSGPSAARNAGVAASNAEFVLFLDDDIVADRHLIDVHLIEVTRPGDDGLPVVTRGPFVEPPDWRPTPWNLWEAKMGTKGTEALVRGDYEPTWRQFHTGNNCMPTELFRAVGGFDETYKRLEDDEFGLRLHEHGCTFRFVPAALAYHYSHRSLEAWLSIPKSYAHYTVLMDRRFPEVGLLASRRAELRHSNPVLRALRVLAGGPRRTDVAVAAAVALGRAAHRIRFTALTVASFSIAFDLSYCESMRATEAACEAGGAASV